MKLGRQTFSHCCNQSDDWLWLAGSRFEFGEVLVLPIMQLWVRGGEAGSGGVNSSTHWNSQVVLLICPCNLLCTWILELWIFVYLWSTEHFSSIRMDSREYSIRDMSGLIEKVVDCFLERILDTFSRSNGSNQNGPWLTMLHLVGVFEFCLTEVVPDLSWMGLNRTISVNTGDDNHYVL